MKLGNKMNLTTLEQDSLHIALEYSICDYQENLQSLIDNRELYGKDTYVTKPTNEKDIKIARQELKGMQRTLNKLLQEIK